MTFKNSQKNTGDEGRQKYYDEHSRVLSMKTGIWSHQATCL
jgi:hypothetical protein